MKLLIIGQTPPPFGGQSINIARMIDVLGRNSFNFQQLRMNFSDDMNENGKASLKKIGRLFKLVLLLLKALIFYRPDYVYYPPSGPEVVPVIRDMILLAFIRLFNVKRIFHFHAGGLHEIYPTLPRVGKMLFRYAFFDPEYSICLNSSGKKDPEFLRSLNVIVIASGVDDLDIFKKEVYKTNERFVILFVGVCRVTKGIIDFLKIIDIVNKKNPNVIGKVVGKAFSSLEQGEINKRVKEGTIIYEGVKTGDEKNRVFAGADLFLFPSFFEHENFPTVILEAFSCSLPVVATRWRGIIDQVIDGYNGYLFEVHDLDASAKHILQIIENKELFILLSQNARLSFIEKYTIAQFDANILKFFNSLL